MQAQGMEQAAMTSDTDWTVLLIVSILLGGLGIDHFMTGKIGTGILKLLTAGGCVIWYILDIINIVSEKFVDSKGLRVVKK